MGGGPLGEQERGPKSVELCTAWLFCVRGQQSGREPELTALTSPEASCCESVPAPEHPAHRQVQKWLFTALTPA